MTLIVSEPQSYFYNADLDSEFIKFIDKQVREWNPKPESITIELVMLKECPVWDAGNVIAHVTGPLRVWVIRTGRKLYEKNGYAEDIFYIAAVRDRPYPYALTRWCVVPS